MKSALTPHFRQNVITQLRNYGKLMRVDKPIGIWLLLWPTLWALWIAGDGQPIQSVFVALVVGTIVVRSAGCVINDFADRNFDGFVKRTAGRPIVTADRTAFIELPGVAAISHG